MSFYVIPHEEDILEHHGIKGQKWGIRRYQNEDGTLTAEGRERYGVRSASDEMGNRERRLYYKDNYENLASEYDTKHKGEDKHSKEYLKAKADYIRENYEKSGRNFEEDKKAYQKHKAAMIAIGATAATAATIYYAPKINKTVQSAISLRSTIKREEEATGSDNFIEFGKKYKEASENGTELDYDRRFQTTSEDRTLPAGYSFKRLTPNSEEAGQGYRGVYVNTNDRDAKLYKSVMGAGIAKAKQEAIINGKSPYSVKKYEREMTANKEMKIAGEKSMHNMVKDILGSGVSDKEAANRLFKANQALAFIGKSEYELPAGLTSKDQDLAKKLLDKAESMGYAGITDMNDNRTLGQGPAILINPDRDTSEKKVHVVGLVEQYIADLTCRAYTYEDLKSKAGS